MFTFLWDACEYVMKVLCSSKTRIYEFFAPAIVRELLQEHLDGKVNRRLFVWSLLSIEQFCRTFVK